MMNSVCFFEIPADDLDGLLKFYGELFGWTFDAVPGKFRYYSINMGDQTIKGGMTARQDDTHTPVNYVRVESLDAARDRAVSLGAKVVVSRGSVPGAGWYAVLLDPQGNRIGLWQEDHNAG
jgi:hypothetical protein